MRIWTDLLWPHMRRLRLADGAFFLMTLFVMAFYDMRKTAVVFQALFLIAVAIELFQRKILLFKNRARTLLVIAYAAFFLWAALSGLWANELSTFVQMLISIAQVAAIGIGVAYYVDTKFRLTYAFFALAVTAIIFCIRFVLTVPPGLWGVQERVGKMLTFGGNRGAIMLAYISLVLVYFAITRRKWWLYLPVTIFMFIAMIFGTRVVLIFLFIGTFVLLVTRAKSIRQFFYSTLILLVVSGAIYLALMNVDVLDNTIGYRIHNVKEVLSEYSVDDPRYVNVTEPKTDANDPLPGHTVAPGDTKVYLPSSARKRLTLIHMAFDVFKSSPLIGIGLDGYRFVNSPFYTYSHNNQMELLATLGLIGFALYYWIQGYFVIQSLRRRRESDWYLLVMAFLIALFVSDAFLMTFNNERDHIYLGLMAGIMFLQTRALNVQGRTDEIETISLKSMKMKRMSIGRKLRHYLIDPGKIVTALAARGFFNWLPDKPYLKMVFRARMKSRLNIEDARTFNEKQQWLKLYYRTDEQIRVADKVEVRPFVEHKIGKDYLIPAIGVYDRVSDIPWSDLPDRFVLKCSHASTANIVCKNKDALDISDAETKLTRWMKRNWFWYGREWPYLAIKPRILAEHFVDDGHAGGLIDYKFFCFDGEPRMMFVATDRQSEDDETKFDFYDLDWNWLPIQNGHPNAGDTLEKPDALDEMISLARTLSKGFPHVRVDFYYVSGKIYFGEMTFYHYSGFTPFIPAQWDVTLGNWLTLPEKTNNEK